MIVRIGIVILEQFVEVFALKAKPHRTTTKVSQRIPFTNTRVMITKTLAVTQLVKQLIAFSRVFKREMQARKTDCSISKEERTRACDDHEVPERPQQLESREAPRLLRLLEPESLKLKRTFSHKQSDPVILQ